MGTVIIMAVLTASYIVILQTAYHVVAFVTAAFDALVLAVSRTISAAIAGDEDRACNVDDHTYLQLYNEFII